MTQPRFLSRAEVAEQPNIRLAQAYGLLRGGEPRSLKIGGRGIWPGYPPCAC